MNHKKGTSWIRRGVASLAVMGAALLLALPAAAAGYVQSNLVSDILIPGMPAKFIDPNLKNPWGISHSATSPFWVSDNGTGVATIYNGAGTPQALVVTIPPPAGSPPGSKGTPTGAVFNTAGSGAFSGDVFLLATEGGTIVGWQGSLGTTAATRVDNSAAGTVYKGLAIGPSFLYAANFHAGNVDVFDTNFAQIFIAGAFSDPNLPSGYAPFNVQNIGGNLFVTYAVASGDEEVPGAGLGIVDRFDLNGNLLQRLISPGGALNAPWGLALAPAGIFGEFSGDLLVGNFGDGTINAFDPTTGDFIAALTDKDGKTIVIDGLWGLIFGNGGNGGATDKLYFTAGLNGEADGLFGSLAVPVPPALILFGSGLIGLLTFSRVKRKGLT